MTQLAHSTPHADLQATVDREFLQGVYSHSLERVKAAVEAGANVNAKDVRGEPVFFSLVRLSFNESLAAYLVESGLDVTTRDTYGLSILKHVVKSGSTLLADAVLRAGHDVDALDDQMRSPLYDAVEADNIEMAKIFLRAGANPNLRDKWYDTPLHVAKSGAMVDLLVAGGAKLDALNGLDFTPLLAAAINGSEELCSRLIELGSPLNALSEERESPLMAIMSRDSVPWSKRATPIEMLCKAGSNLEEQNGLGRTPLAIAASADGFEVCRILAEFGANLEARDTQGRTPLLIAANAGRAAAVIALIESGADMHARDYVGFGLDELAAPNPGVVAALASHRARSTIRDVLKERRRPGFAND